MFCCPKRFIGFKMMKVKIPFILLVVFLITASVVCQHHPRGAVAHSERNLGPKIKGRGKGRTKRQTKTAGKSNNKVVGKALSKGRIKTWKSADPPGKGGIKSATAPGKGGSKSTKSGKVSLTTTALCSDYTCPDGYDLIPDAASVEGSDLATCCIQITALLCSDYTCEEGYELRPNPETIQGSDRATCCIATGVCGGLPVGSPCALGDISLSLIPNPSFEDFESCPDDRSQLDLAVGWTQATLAPNDYYVGEPSCDDSWYTDPTSTRFHAKSDSADGIAYVGIIAQPVDDYFEYVGGCLLSPLLAGVDYTMSVQAASSGTIVLGNDLGGDTDGSIDLI